MKGLTRLFLQPSDSMNDRMQWTAGRSASSSQNIRHFPSIARRFGEFATKDEEPEENGG
jgi:hypothetical protein